MKYLDKASHGIKVYKDIEKNNSIYKSNSITEDLICLVCYFKKNNIDRNFTEKYIQKILKQFYSIGIEKQNNEIINNKLKKCMKEYDSYIPLNITVTDKEVELIKSFNGNTSKLIFLFMCIYKIYGSNSYRIRNSFIRNIINKNIKTEELNSIIRKLLFFDLIELRSVKNKFNGSVFMGYIFKDKLINNKGNVIYNFYNLDNFNLIYDYITNKNKNIIFCQSCGKICEKMSNRQKMCNICSKDKSKNIKNGYNKKI